MAVADVGDTRSELRACGGNVVHALRETAFGPVIRALLSQIAINPVLGDPHRSTVAHARREEVARIMERGIARGDLRPDAEIDIATELLVGPVYHRLVLGGELGDGFADQVGDAAYRAFASG